MADRNSAPPVPIRTSLTHGPRPHSVTQTPINLANNIPLPTRTHTHPQQHVIQSIDQIQTVQRSNDYVEIGTPALPPRRKSLPSNTRNHNQSKLCQDNHTCAELTVCIDNESPPPLMPRLPKRQPKSASAPLRSVSCPQPPPIRRDTKPPIHKLSSFMSPHKQHHIPVPAVLFVDTSSKSSKCESWESRHVLPVRQTVIQPPIVDEPKADKVKENKSKSKTQQHATLDNNGRTQSTIRCANCGKSKCKSCVEDKKLPERWVCDGNCRLSADTCVDVASCMCIAKGVTYHMCDEQEGEKVEHPCSCTNTPNCCKRWAALGVLSLCFPCLLCYLPLKGCVKAAEACNNSTCVRQRGCQCER